MGMARKLYQLQVIELEIESKENALAQCLGQLGQNQVVAEAKARLLSAQERLETVQYLREQYTKFFRGNENESGKGLRRTVRVVQQK